MSSYLEWASTIPEEINLFQPEICSFSPGNTVCKNSQTKYKLLHIQHDYISSGILYKYILTFFLQESI